MANKIEILENTIVKLLFRRGTDAERKTVTFDLGEPALTTDSKRLFVGDGSTVGGVPAGNRFLGFYTTAALASLTAATAPVSGDYFYNTTESKMLFLSGTPSGVISSWGRFA
jgi:hypothetical protein